MSFLGREDHLPEPPIVGLLPGAESVVDRDFLARGLESESPRALSAQVPTGAGMSPSSLHNHVVLDRLDTADALMLRAISAALYILPWVLTKPLN